MRDNPAGILVIRDELSGWLATLDKPGREGERGFFLSAWNGDTGYTWTASDAAASMSTPAAYRCLAGYSPRDCGATWPMPYRMAR